MKDKIFAVKTYVESVLSQTRSLYPNISYKEYFQLKKLLTCLAGVTAGILLELVLLGGLYLLPNS